MSSGQEGTGSREGQECQRLDHRKRRGNAPGKERLWKNNTDWTRRRVYVLDLLPEISDLWMRSNFEQLPRRYHIGCLQRLPRYLERL